MELIVKKKGEINSNQAEILNDNLELINRFSQVPLQRNQIYICSVYLCNDIIDAYASRFTKQALEQICQLIVGESVLKGHQHNSLPIARFFKAEIVNRENHHWVRAWFYWLKDTDGALDLARNIDGGVYREVSIAWRYQTATCSICKQDIRKCHHFPGDYYEGNLCYYEMTDIKEFLEGNLVKEMLKCNWVWMPHAGHWIESDKCRFFLTTYVGGYIVSTVGEAKEGETFIPVGSGPEIYETMVFKAGKREDANGGLCCQYKIIDYSEVDGERYMRPNDAVNGHYYFCEKWSKGE